MKKFIVCIGLAIMALSVQAAEPVTKSNKVAYEQLRNKIKSHIKLEQAFRTPGFEAEVKVVFEINSQGIINVIDVENAQENLANSIKKQIESITVPKALNGNVKQFTVPIILKFHGQHY